MSLVIEGQQKINRSPGLENGDSRHYSSRLHPAAGTSRLHLNGIIKADTLSDISSPDRQSKISSSTLDMDSARFEEIHDAKKYVQLVKICDQMRHRQVLVGQYESELAKLYQVQTMLNREYQWMSAVQKEQRGQYQESQEMRTLKSAIQRKNQEIRILQSELQTLERQADDNMVSYEAKLKKYCCQVALVERKLNAQRKQSELAISNMQDLKNQRQFVGEDVSLEFNTLQAQINQKKELIRKERALNLEAQARAENERQAAREAARLRLKSVRQRIIAHKQQLNSKSVYRQSKRQTLQRQAHEQAKKVITQLQIEVGRLQIQKRSEEADTSYSSAVEIKAKQLNQRCRDLQQAKSEVDIKQAQLSAFNQSQSIASPSESCNAVYEQLQAMLDRKQSAEDQLSELKSQLESLAKERENIILDTPSQELEGLKHQVDEQTLKLSKDLELLENQKTEIREQVNQIKACYDTLVQQQSTKVPDFLVQEYRNKVHQQKTIVSNLVALEKETAELRIRIDQLGSKNQERSRSQKDEVDRTRTMIEQIRSGCESIQTQLMEINKQNSEVSTKLIEYSEAYPVAAAATTNKEQNEQQTTSCNNNQNQRTDKQQQDVPKEEPDSQKQQVVVTIQDPIPQQQQQLDHQGNVPRTQNKQVEEKSKEQPVLTQQQKRKRNLSRILIAKLNQIDLNAEAFKDMLRPQPQVTKIVEQEQVSQQEPQVEQEAQQEPEQQQVQQDAQEAEQELSQEQPEEDQVSTENETAEQNSEQLPANKTSFIKASVLVVWPLLLFWLAQ